MDYKRNDMPWTFRRKLLQISFEEERSRIGKRGSHVLSSAKATIVFFRTKRLRYPSAPFAWLPAMFFSVAGGVDCRCESRRLTFDMSGDGRSMEGLDASLAKQLDISSLG